MGTLQFNKNGPVIVTEEDFKIFQKSNYSSFDQMFYAWLDENNRNGVRRLIIRDLLRQSQHANGSNLIYHQTEHGFGRIMHVGGGNKSKDLYWTLRNRPRLLDEITSELLYNLERNYLPLQSIDQNSFVQLLELLLTVTQEPTTVKLWQYHPINIKKDCPLPKLMTERLRLYTGRTNLPQFLRNEIWQKISQDLTAAINARQSALLEDGIPPIAEDYMTQVIVNFIDTLNQESYHDDSRSVDMVSDCVELLEASLPYKVQYLDYIDLERIIPKLHNRELAAKSLCRHILIYTMTDLSNTKSNFLYWARGIITLHRRGKQKECLEKIDACLSGKIDFEITLQ